MPFLRAADRASATRRHFLEQSEYTFLDPASRVQSRGDGSRECDGSTRDTTYSIFSPAGGVPLAVSPSRSIRASLSMRLFVLFAFLALVVTSVLA